MWQNVSLQECEVAERDQGSDWWQKSTPSAIACAVVINNDSLAHMPSNQSLFYNYRISKESSIL